MYIHHLPYGGSRDVKEDEIKFFYRYFNPGVKTNLKPGPKFGRYLVEYLFII